MALRSALFFVLLLIGSNAGAAIVSGKVVSGVTPLPGMTVSAYTAAGTLAGSGVTSATGTYSLVLTNGDYRLLAWDPAGLYATSFHSGADSFSTSKLVTVDRNLTIDFALVRGSYLAGRVATVNGTPLAGMVVAVYNTSGTERGWTSSDGAGNYRLVVPPGSYRMAAWDDTLIYLPRFNGDARTFEAAPLLSTSAATTETVNFTLPLAARLGGRVTDALTGAPLAAVTATAWDATGAPHTVTSDSGGDYVLALEPGSYRLVFHDAGGIYAPSFHDASSFNGAEWLMLAAGTTRIIPASLSLAARLEGAVTNSSGSPVAGVTAVAYNLDGSVRGSTETGTDGLFSLVVPGSGSFRIGVHDDLYRFATRFYPATARFLDGSAIQTSGGVTHSGLNLSLLPAGLLSVVVSSSTGVPLRGLAVEVQESGSRTALFTLHTNADGEARFPLAAGSYDVEISHTERYYDTVRIEGIAVMEGQTAVVEAEMNPATTRRRAGPRR
ncbi:MAG TPA: carboxypeptidase regulatory-like domain-containing protein [Thermoanaerobaculia bacterium]